MNRNSAPGLGQWITVSLMVVVSMFLLYKLYQYAGTRTTYPTGLTIGGVDVGGMSEEEARAAVTKQYLDTAVTPVSYTHLNWTPARARGGAAASPLT